VDLDQVADNIRLSVLDARTGQIVNSMDLGPQVAGEVGFDWNGGNFDGEAAPAGDYIFQAEDDQWRQIQRIACLWPNARSGRFF